MSMQPFPEVSIRSDAAARRAGGSGKRLELAILCNSVPPYRLHLHQRVAREIPAIRLWTVRTHDEDGRWLLDLPPEIGFISFSDGLPCTEQGRLRHAIADWRKGGRIIRWMREKEIGAVILSGYNDVGRVRILRWCKANGIPCFVTGDSNILDEHLGLVKRWTKKVVLTRILALAAGVMPFGTAGRDYFLKYGVPPDRIFYFPLEPDAQLIAQTTDADARAVIERFGMDQQRSRLLYCGRLVNRKRVDLLIDAFCAVASSRPDWELVILGDGPERTDLRARVPKVLETRIIWAGHSSDQTVVNAFYRACSVLVLPSDREPWALVIHEALLAGMAVVSSSVPGAAVDLIRDGVNGYIFPPGDQAALIQQLCKVTETGRIDSFRQASMQVLADWRRRADPIDGLRKALNSVGLLAACKEE